MAPVPPAPFDVRFKEAPSHNGLFEEAVTVSRAGSVMITCRVTVHPLASVTVRSYVPAARLVRSSLVEVNPAGPVHAKV